MIRKVTGTLYATMQKKLSFKQLVNGCTKIEFPHPEETIGAWDITKKPRLKGRVVRRRKLRYKYNKSHTLPCKDTRK